ncbi:AraC family transcriptional regulator [Micromonospora peucetia]|uniref:helix-turn-helix domain-containing protein n=1 Tax=Micromonospora peucetia TaxID=47871 RepID=UPI002258C2BA|nr:AraC family transcriptional regulator [Micromonospora peucetia]MCX4387260.1 AraC family transcriptional regulator [Micromonospora peucetia]
MRHQPRRDSRGILDPHRLLREVRFRRRLPAPALRPYVEHYWLVDWELTEPFAQKVVPHPAVNVVFSRFGDAPETAEIAGVGQRLFSITLAGNGRVCGVQFRPGGFRPFWGRPVAELTGQRRPLTTGFPAAGPAAGPTGPSRVGASGALGGSPVCGGTDDERCAALDAFLTAWAPEPDPVADEVIALVQEIRSDRSVLRVDDFAQRHDSSVRRLQRLFLAYVGVGPKWVIRRYRLQEAIEQAADGPQDWATLAADLGYSDQAHLVREFTAVAGIPPAAYARSLG